jgi:hypothetical protein
MMEAVCTSETSVYFNDTTRRCIPECCHLHTRRCENLKSHKSKVALTVIAHGNHNLRSLTTLWWATQLNSIIWLDVPPITNFLYYSVITHVPPPNDSPDQASHKHTPVRGRGFNSAPARDWSRSKESLAHLWSATLILAFFLCVWS